MKLIPKIRDLCLLATFHFDRIFIPLMAFSVQVRNPYRLGFRGGRKRQAGVAIRLHTSEHERMTNSKGMTG